MSDKHILALQSFLAPHQENIIQQLCEPAFQMAGVDCAFTYGAIPHMTTGSWKVTTEELQEAEQTFSERITGLERISFPVELAISPRSGARHFASFRPVDPSSIAPFHFRACELLNFPYETFREQDVPGQWRPHITLFFYSAGADDAMDSLLDRLRCIDFVTITRIGLVKIDPIRALVETDLAS